MVHLISCMLVILIILLAIPVAVFVVEILAATASSQPDCLATPSGQSRPSVAVLVPAHNESTGLLPTLADIKAQMQAIDRLLVVADNCSDDTAAVAAAAGADVIHRNDPDNRGKGYALASGVRRLELDPPDIVIIIDADCRLAEAAIDRLAATCAAARRPVQALYLMIAPDESPINSRVAEFAWRVKNWVRPLGLRALGLPCQLTGSGMAFPWEVIRSADLASGSIVEDLKLGLDLALAGSPAVFCPSARVTSEFPFTAEGIRSQRMRWEQGHVGTILTTTPRLIFAAIARANLNLLALALDVAIPPLSLLGVLVMGIWGSAAVATLLGMSSTPLLISTAGVFAFFGGAFLAWLKCGRDILPPSSVFLILAYVGGKLPIYRHLLLHKSGQQWIRTNRRKT